MLITYPRSYEDPSILSRFLAMYYTANIRLGDIIIAGIFTQISLELYSYWAEQKK